MKIITDILILSFVDVFFLQRTAGSPEHLLPEHVSVEMSDCSRFEGFLVKGQRLGKFRHMPYWMNPGNKRPIPETYVYVLLKNGAHYESALDADNVPKGHQPDHPLNAKLRMVNDEYYTTRPFHFYNASSGCQHPSVANDPPDSRIYVAMEEGLVYSAILNQYIPIEKQPSLIVQEGASTSRKYKKRKIE